jgi:hypothetical protein
MVNIHLKKTRFILIKIDKYMKLKKMIKFIFILIIFSSCKNNQNETKSLEDLGISINKVSGEINFDFEILKSNGINIKCITLKKNERTINQKILLDTAKSLRIENFLGIHSNRNYLNTWTSTDENGLFDYEQSYFYELDLDKKNDTLYLICYFPSSIFDEGRYIVTGNFNKEFKLVKGDTDTIFFNANNIAKIPIEKYKIGENNKRFLIVDESEKNNDTIKRRTIYVSKDYYILNR